MKNDSLLLQISSFFSQKQALLRVPCAHCLKFALQVKAGTHSKHYCQFRRTKVSWRNGLSRPRKRAYKRSLGHHLMQERKTATKDQWSQQKDTGAHMKWFSLDNLRTGKNNECNCLSTYLIYINTGFIIDTLKSEI